MFGMQRNEIQACGVLNEMVINTTFFLLLMSFMNVCRF